MDREPKSQSSPERRKEYLEKVERELRETSVIQTGKAYGDGKGGIIVHPPQSIESLREWAIKGNMAVMINIAKKEIYIGDDHRGMGDSQAIPDEDLLAGITEFNRTKNTIEMQYLGDRRKSSRTALGDTSEIKDDGPLRSKRL